MGKRKKHNQEPDELEPLKAEEVYDLIMKEFPNAVVKKVPMANGEDVYGHSFNLTIVPNFIEYGFNAYKGDITYSVERFRWKRPEDNPENYDVWIGASFNTIELLKKDFKVVHKMIELGRYLTTMEELSLVFGTL